MRRMNTPKYNHYTRHHKDWKGDCNAKPKHKSKQEIAEEVFMLFRKKP